MTIYTLIPCISELLNGSLRRIYSFLDLLASPQTWTLGSKGLKTTARWKEIETGLLCMRDGLNKLEGLQVE